MKVRLRKVSANENNLRTTEVIGECLSVPTVGQPLVVLGDPLNDQMSVRIVQTSPIRSVKETTEGFEFETQNSKYTLEVLND